MTSFLFVIPRSNCLFKLTTKPLQVTTVSGDVIRGRPRRRNTSRLPNAADVASKWGESRTWISTKDNNNNHNWFTETQLPEHKKTSMFKELCEFINLTHNALVTSTGVAPSATMSLYRATMGIITTPDRPTDQPSKIDHCGYKYVLLYLSVFTDTKQRTSSI